MKNDIEAIKKRSAEARRIAQARLDECRRAGLAQPWRVAADMRTLSYCDEVDALVAEIEELRAEQTENQWQLGENARLP